MEIVEYKKIADREEAYFWHVGRREILNEALLRSIPPSTDREVLDMGCGPGGNFLFLRNFGLVTGVDISEEALRFARTRPFKSLHQGSATSLPFSDGAFSLVSSLDVFEHIVDDEGAMRECARVLAPGGILLVTVPSYQWLWSDHDRALHHVRRYSSGDFRKKVESAGFEIMELSHFVVVAVVINFLRKCFGFINKNKGKTPQSFDADLPGWANSLLLAMLRCEKYVMRFLALPIGTSIMLVAKKR